MSDVVSQKVLHRLFESYHRIFEDGNAVKEIRHLIQALQNGRKILDLLEPPSGTFSTIFVPFHAGTVTDDGRQYRDLSLPQACKTFMEDCGKIESLTDGMPAKGIEPDPEARQRLLRALQDFLLHFPTPEEVASWR